MPSPTTAIDLISRSMRLANILAAGETPSADEAIDALATLNDLLENWDTEPMSLWGTDNFAGTTVPGQTTYTIGPGGNFNTTRPAAIRAAYMNVSGVDFQIQVIGQLEYNLIALKNYSQPICERLLYINEFPLGTVVLWPAPAQASTISLTFDRLLTQIPTTATAINYPPGAAKALRLALAIELAQEYGKPTSPVLLDMASTAKADYKRANKQPVIAQMDQALTNNYASDWRIG